MFRKLLVGYDGSKGAKAALQYAAALARDYKAELSVLWVREPLPRHSDLPGEFAGEEEAAQEYFAERRSEARQVAAESGLAIQCDMRAGHPAKTIVNYADEGGFDLIVVGHSDHSSLWGRFLGDTADRISDHAHCSVLIVKE